VKTKQLVIIGDSAFAEIAYEYFTHDSEYEVVAFSVEQAYLTRDTLFGLPVVPFETLEQQYPPAQHAFYAALVYTERNRLRARLYQEAKAKGYQPASYISSRAFVWRNCKIGEHCFIFENNVVQPFVTLGDNVVLWSGNHIGHHSTIGDHCFISSHVVISGFVNVGASCFMGVNSTVANNLTIGADCLVGASAVILSDVDENRTVIGQWRKKNLPAASKAPDPDSDTEG
jgi:sugar O-acyltransferase (sialic acid O-acetyltransferase NeuD family)